MPLLILISTNSRGGLQRNKIQNLDFTIEEDDDGCPVPVS